MDRQFRAQIQPPIEFAKENVRGVEDRRFFPKKKREGKIPSHKAFFANTRSHIRGVYNERRRREILPQPMLHSAIYCHVRRKVIVLTPDLTYCAEGSGLAGFFPASFQI